MNIILIIIVIHTVVTNRARLFKQLFIFGFLSVVFSTIKHKYLTFCLLSSAENKSNYVRKHDETWKMWCIPFNYPMNDSIIINI